MTSRAHNPVARTFFATEFADWSGQFAERANSPVLNKIEAIIAHDKLRNVLGQAASTLHIEQALARNRIVIVNLASRHLGEAPAFFMGSLIIAARSSNHRTKGDINLVFSEPELELRQWTVIDNQGLSTTIALSDTQSGIELPGALFTLPEKNPFTRQREE